MSPPLRWLSRRRERPCLGDAVLAGALAFSCKVCVYVVNRAESYLQSLPRAMLCLGLPAIAALLLGAALCSSRSRRNGLALALFTTILCLYAAELILVFMTPQDRRKQRVLERGKPYDERPKIEVVREYRNQGLDAYPTVHPSALLKPGPQGGLVSAIRLNDREILPLGGVGNVLTVYNNENGQYTVFESDPFGFHNPGNVWLAPDLDLAVVGDSFVQGAGVDSDKNFVALIREDVPNTLNLGSGGNGPLLMLASMREYLARRRPAVTLFCYFEGNDLAGLARSRKSRLLMRYLEPGFTQALENRREDLDAALREYVETEFNRRGARAFMKARPRETRRAAVREIAKFTSLRLRLGLVHSRIRAAPPADLALFRRVLTLAAAECRAWGGSLWFVYLPAWSRYQPLSRSDDSREKVLAIAEALDLPVIDLHEDFAASGDPLALFWYRLNGHYNEKGCRIVAARILRELEARENTDANRARKLVVGAGQGKEG